MKQKSKQDIDKPKVQSLEDILKELDEEDELSDEEKEAERRMEELLAGELVRVRVRAWLLSLPLPTVDTVACESLSSPRERTNERTRMEWVPLLTMK